MATPRRPPTPYEPLRAKAAQILELVVGLEELTKGTPARYAATRARVEARAALEQAEELRRTLVELGERLRGMRRRWHLEVEVFAGEEV